MDYKNKDFLEIFENAVHIIEQEVLSYFKSDSDKVRSHLSLYNKFKTCFEQIDDKELYIIYGYDNPSENVGEIIKEAYQNTVDSWAEVIEKELNRVIEFYLKTSNVSVGEAVIFAEKHFQEEIGFIEPFLQLLSLSIWEIRMNGGIIHG